MANKQEDLLRAISDAIPHIKESFPYASENEILDAIMDYIRSLVSNPVELISKLTLPSEKELRLSSRKEYLKSQRSRFRSKRMDEVRSRNELVAILTEIKEQLDEEGRIKEASIFSDHITKFESDCVIKSATMMRIDSDISGLINYRLKYETDRDIERLWSQFGD